MTPAEFAREIVIPTLEDFRADRTSRRWAYLSAIAVYHLRDHLAEALASERGIAAGRPVTSIDVRVASREMNAAVRAALAHPEALEVVRGVANGAKHALTRSSGGVMFKAGADWVRPAAVADELECDSSELGDGAGGREIPHEGRRLDVYRAAAAVFLAFVSAFPAQLEGCSFDPYPEARGAAEA